MQAFVLIFALTVLAGFLAYLGLLAFIVTRTGDTRGLRDVAVAIRAYRGVLAIVSKPMTTSESDSSADLSPDP